MKTAQDVIDADLQYICGNLKSEFSQMAGKKLLIVGGAGFLGYYLVQSVLYWNETAGTAPIQLTVYDNYIRGIPDWLTKLKDQPNLTLAKHDITHPLPADIEDFQYIVHAASIASPTYYRKYPIETMDANVNGLRILLDYCQQQKAAGKPVEGFLFFSTSEIYGDPSPENIPTPKPTAEMYPVRDREPAMTNLSAMAKRFVLTLPSSTICPLKSLVRSTTTVRD